MILQEVLQRILFADSSRKGLALLPRQEPIVTEQGRISSFGGFPEELIPEHCKVDLLPIVEEFSPDNKQTADRYLQELRSGFEREVLHPLRERGLRLPDEAPAT